MSGSLAAAQSGSMMTGASMVNPYTMAAAALMTEPGKKVAKKAVSTRGRKRLSKTQKVLNLLNRGESVSWKTLRNRFDLQSPRAMVDKLRAQGNMIYINKCANGTSYRIGTPTKAIIAAGITKLYGVDYAYSNVA